MNTPSNLSITASWSSPPKSSELSTPMMQSVPVAGVLVSSTLLVSTKFPNPSAIERKFELAVKKRRLNDMESTMESDSNVLKDVIKSYLLPTSFMKINRKIVVHIMTSGEDSLQAKALHRALSTFPSPEALKLKYFTLAEATKKGWSSSYFIRRFTKNADVFLFNCHPVQGDLPPVQPLWNFRNHLRNLRETFKPEVIMYPEDPDAIILDPIFRQDKEQLYELIKDFMTPSIIINRPEDDESFNEKVLTKIFNFAKDNHDYHPKTGAGKWHIKGGFSTASRAVTIANSIPEIPARCRQIFKRLGHHSIPYVILQRSFANSVEHKVVFLSDPSRGIFYEPYIAHSHIHGQGHSFSFPPHDRLFGFARMIRQKLIERCPCLSSCAILRIDIFITQTGELVVNEVEGLEAYIPAIGRNRGLIDSIAYTFINDYWDYRLNSLVLKAIENIIKTPGNHDEDDSDDDDGDA